MHDGGFSTRERLDVGGVSYVYHSLARLEEFGFHRIPRLPISLRILLINVLHQKEDSPADDGEIESLAGWRPDRLDQREIAFRPSRVVLQDFTGVPAVVDLAAMRDAMVRLGGDPSRVNPRQPVDLVIDHSVQVDHFGSEGAFQKNVELEFARNGERYSLLKWAQDAFRNFRVVPPGTGIVHQVNLEYLATVARTERRNGERWVIPDTLVGTDSHTTMINALGVLGWGVGGIEAEAAMLGRPVPLLVPEIVGVRFTGRLQAPATATDLVLSVTEMLRRVGVVGKFVEFFGPGLTTLGIADRATISNMCPEYGATVAYFPVDAQTIDYLHFTGREDKSISLVESYFRAQGLWRDPAGPEPEFSRVVEFDLDQVRPSLAGPRRPQDRVDLAEVGPSYRRAVADALETPGRGISHEKLEKWLEEGGSAPPDQGAPGEDGVSRLDAKVNVSLGSERFVLEHGSVVIAAITSCTNTSNPSVMLGAGLLARRAVEKGLRRKPWVKTSIAPGSRVVTDYLDRAGLWPPLESLGFHLVGHGCTTCIGNSGPLPPEIAAAIRKGNLVTAAVLSGNRNFEGRINPLVRANYLASPLLVVAFAIAGTVDIDMESEPLGRDRDGHPVFLRDIWPSPEEIARVVEASVTSSQFHERYATVFEGDERWKALISRAGDLFPWDTKSTYVKEPPFLREVTGEPPPLQDIRGARVLALLGDSVTTDHISPAGAIPPGSPAATWLESQGVQESDFNSFGSRRGNHEVMIRGTFGNIRLRNQMVPGVEGGFTRELPDAGVTPIYEAAVRYARAGVPLVVLAGKEYGTGSSRDWAAKGTLLLGVRAVIARSFERIHRSNLVGMGVLPLQFEDGEDASHLGLSGDELIDIIGMEDDPVPGKSLRVTAHKPDGPAIHFTTICRIDTPLELAYFRHGGVLPFTLRELRGE